MAAKGEEAAGVTAFDALYTTNELQKLKILLPYIEPALQKQLAVYIKYMELRYTMKYVRRHPPRIYGCDIPSGAKPDLPSLCRQLSCYSTPEEIRQLEQLQNMLQTLETVQEMTQTMSALQELFPDLASDASLGNGFAFSRGDSADPAQAGQFSVMDMLLNMLTPEQKAMYEKFQQTEENRAPG